MKKRFSLFIFVLAAFIFGISGCDINNPVIDEWWVGEPVDQGRGDVPFTQETYIVSFYLDGGKYVDSINGNSPDVSVQRVWAHAHASVPGLVAKDNNYFKGWYKEANHTNRWVFDTDEANATNDGLDGVVDDIITLYAGWESSGYTVDFDINFPDEANDFDPKADLTYTPLQESIANGAYAAEPLQFGLKSDSDYVDNYVFTGWYKTEEAADDPLNNQIHKWDFAVNTVTKKETLYAGWVEIATPEPRMEVYTVIFASDTDNPPPDQYVLSGEKVIAPYVTYRNGYSFGGWYKDAACTDDWVFSGNDTDKANAANDGLYVGGSEKTDKTITLYAKWAPVAPVQFFVVSFDSGGGKYVDEIGGGGPGVSVQRVWAHAHASVPGLVEKENNYFKGWYDEPTGGNKWDFANNTVEKDMTLYAQWAPSGGYTVDFIINFPPEASDFVPETDLTYVPVKESIADGALAAEPLQFGLKSDSDYVDTYVFTGWYDEPTGGTKWNFATMTATADKAVNGTITLYARWAEILNPETPLEVYTVIFDSKADINPPPNQYVISGETVIAPYVTYRSGYFFGGWYKDAACTNDWVFSGADTDKADSANDGLYGATDKTITLYAKWAPAAPVPQEFFVVSFDLGGGEYVNSINGNSSSVSVQRVWAHAHASVPGLVEKANNYFTGWYDAQTGDNKWDFANDTVEKDMTLFAQWAPSGGYTVDFIINFPPEEPDFDPEDDLTYEPKQESIAHGAFAAEPLQFGIKPDTRFANRYVFIGWYKTDAAADAPLDNQINKWDFAVDTVKKNEILYAGWVKIENPEPPDPPKPPIVVYTVQFDSKTINPPPNQYVISGEKVIAPYVTYRDGYAFGGWYKDAGVADDWDFANDTVTANITLYAKWAPVAEVDILNDVDIIDFRYILFSGGQEIFNDPAAPGSSTNLTADEKATNVDEIKKIAAYLNKYSNYRVMVVGHANPATQYDKDHPQNEELMNLSQGRADAVKEKIEAELGTLGSQYDLTKTPIKTRAEGGRRAMEQPMLSRRVEVIVFDITTVVTQ